jgi:hypothetical protein
MWDVREKIADCGLRIADCGLRIAEGIEKYSWQLAASSRQFG